MSRWLGAVGTLIADLIEHPSRPAVRQWGGAAYSLSALSAACPPGWSIEPIMKVGADVAGEAVPIIDALPNVVTGSGVRIVPEPNNRVHLQYHDDAHRCETLTGGVPAWSWEELREVIGGLDALYLNFISGMEMGLETAFSLRAAYPGFIYADLHSLFLGPPDDGPRRPRPLPEWEHWIGCFDAVQMNDEELALLGVDLDDLGSLLALGPALVVVTRGPEGASFVRSMPDGEPRAGTVPPPDGLLEGDPTGCGDVWGATLCAALVAGIALEEAIERAHRAAAAKIRNPNVSELREVLASSNAPYPVLP